MSSLVAVAGAVQAKAAFGRNAANNRRQRFDRQKEAKLQDSQLQLEEDRARKFFDDNGLTCVAQCVGSSIMVHRLPL
jgi:hypothetical protein